ncbi:MAG: hypothetical protein EPO24_04510 [Bacteroidetes bacterium]|nr:MAG: hypothetical protein EPO24_04510 [Bacteroidota bacterium]
MNIINHKVLFLLLALNYFAYQVELFEEEYKENHREPSSVLSFAPNSVTWETFGKTSAQKAFVLLVDVAIEQFGILQLPKIRITPPLVTFDIVRDKSPPLLLA